MKSTEMFGESLYSCFSGRRRRRPYPAPLPDSPEEPISSSRGSSGVFKNLSNSLASDNSETLTPALSPSADGSSSSSHDAPDDGGGGGLCPSERDLSTAIASRRLLPASPGRSNSIVDAAKVGVGAGAGVAVPTYSPDPYWDFRRSMEEMLAALGLDDDAAARRAHLHELLICYLALNRKHAHKYIVSAFSDIVVALASPAAAEGGRTGA